jgi:hypothetical protein
VQTNGPYGRVLSCYVVSPTGADGSNLFAGDFITGVYHSTNNGASWTLVDNGIGPNVLTLADSGTRLFAGSMVVPISPPIIAEAGRQSIRI